MANKFKIYFLAQPNKKNTQKQKHLLIKQPVHCAINSNNDSVNKAEVGTDTTHK